MISVINICNMALAIIGQPSVNSIDENSESARQCRIHFDLSRDVVLSAHPWTFAINIESLAKINGVSPIPAYSIMYKKPPDALRIIRLINPDASISRCSNNDILLEVYKEVNYNDMAVLLSNIPLALVEYVRRVVSPAQWDSIFVEALKWKLAESLSSAISGSGQRTAELNSMYEQTLLRAKVVNANNDSSFTRLPTSLRDSRR